MKPPSPFTSIPGINKQFGTTICISDSIYEQAKADLLARPIKRVQVKGRKTEFMIYELLAIRTSDDPDLRVRDQDEKLSAMTWQASQRFEAGDFPAAQRAYRDILREFPEDALARLMRRKARENNEPILPMSPKG